jgi:BspA type Leucine rich repeat region (6 copies)
VTIPTNINGQTVTSIGFMTVTNSITGEISDVGAFAYTPLASVTIPNSVTSFEAGAFAECGLPSITIPNSVTNIGAGALSGCGNLRNVTIPASVTNIGAGVFDYCFDLTNATILGNITSIPDYMFWDCRLTSFTIPATVTYIGIEALFDNFSLTSVYCNGNAPTLSYAVPFYGENPTFYYLPGTIGWGDFSTNNGFPVAEWYPSIQASGNSFGLTSNQFGFNIEWASGQVVVVEACANLASPAWIPLQTLTLTNGSAYFSDAQWTNYPSRYYRISSP